MISEKTVGFAKQLTKNVVGLERNKPVCTFMYMSHCQNSSKFLSIAYFMKTADVIMFVFSSHDRTNHTW